MTDKAEPGDVRPGVQPGLGCGARGVAIERDHRGDGGGEILGAAVPVLVRRREDAGADGLREPEGVAGRERALAHDAVGVDATGDRQPELWLLVDDGVAARDHAAALRELVDRPGHQPLEQVEREILGPRDDVEREEDLSAHRVDVGHRVRGGDRPCRIRVVDDRREEIDGLDDRELVGNAIDRRVIGRLQSDEQLSGVGLRGEGAQDLRQWAGAQLRASAGAGRQAGEPDLLTSEHAMRIAAGLGSKNGSETGRGPREIRWERSELARLALGRYLPVLTYWMQSPWFLNVESSARVMVTQPPFLHSSLPVVTATAAPRCTLSTVQKPASSAMMNGTELLTVQVGFAATNAAQFA